TSHQIRTQADCLLAKELADVDGSKEKRIDTVSVFNGPRPLVATSADERAEGIVVGRWLSERAREGVAAEEMAVLVRSTGQYSRARAAVEAAGLKHFELDASGRVENARVAIGTMHQS